jgi:hypothetical protein
MAVLDNFKNFIRHGKTGREGNGSDLSASSSGANLTNKQGQGQKEVSIGACVKLWSGAVEMTSS